MLQTEKNSNALKLHGAVIKRAKSEKLLQIYTSNMILCKVIQTLLVTTNNTGGAIHWSIFNGDLKQVRNHFLIQKKQSILISLLSQFHAMMPQSAGVSTHWIPLHDIDCVQEHTCIKSFCQLPTWMKKSHFGAPCT